MRMCSYPVQISAQALHQMGLGSYYGRANRHRQTDSGHGTRVIRAPSNSSAATPVPEGHLQWVVGVYSACSWLSVVESLQAFAQASQAEKSTHQSALCLRAHCWMDGIMAS